MIPFLLPALCSCNLESQSEAEISALDYYKPRRFGKPVSDKVLIERCRPRLRSITTQTKDVLKLTLKGPSYNDYLPPLAVVTASGRMAAEHGASRPMRASAQFG